jgi:methylated-DNA-protein-cysteine methyltransferase-like protein
MNPASRMAYYVEVWEMVRQIPVGCVATYGQIASLIYPPEGITPQAYKAFGPRWVGGAMAACPDDVPWQRVINSQGKISLRRGEGQTLQKELLEAEGIIFDERERVDLSRFRWSGPEEK